MSSKKLTKHCIAIVAAMIASFSLSDIAQAQQVKWAVGNMIKDSTLNVRTGPSTQYAIAHKLKEGTNNLIVYQCLNNDGTELVTWCKIGTESGVLGWASKRYLIKTQEYNLVQKTDLNLREGYRSADDPCKVVHGGDLVNHITSRTTLVACPKGNTNVHDGFRRDFDTAEEIVTTTQYVVFSVPR